MKAVNLFEFGQKFGVSKLSVDPARKRFKNDCLHALPPIPNIIPLVVVVAAIMGHLALDWPDCHRQSVMGKYRRLAGFKAFFLEDKIGT